MSPQTTPPKAVSSPSATTNSVTTPASSSPDAGSAPAYSAPYAKVRRLIEANRWEEALPLARSRYDAPMKNALGVCLMRMGQPEAAVGIYRALVLDSTGLFLRVQVPTIYKTNFAFALMLSGRIVGGMNILDELSGDDHPSVQQLRSAVEAWKSRLSFGQKLALWFGLEPNVPVVLDFPPGQLL